MKFIILEGPDGAGKSTLAAGLKELFEQVGHRVFVRHYGPSDQDVPIIEQYLFPTMGLRTGDVPRVREFEDITIFDRHYLGEMIYGPILRGESQITHHERAAIERYLDEIGAIKVLVIDELHDLLERFTERGDDIIKADQLKDIHRQYLNLTSTNNQAYLGAKRWIHWTPLHSQLAGLWDLA